MGERDYIKAKIEIPVTWMKTFEKQTGIDVTELNKKQLTALFETSIASVDYTNKELLEEIKHDIKSNK